MIKGWVLRDFSRGANSSTLALSQTQSSPTKPTTENAGSSFPQSGQPKHFLGFYPSSNSVG